MSEGEQSGGVKALAFWTAVLGLIAAGLVLVVRFYEIRKARIEAEVAEASLKPPASNSTRSSETQPAVIRSQKPLLALTSTQFMQTYPDHKKQREDDSRVFEITGPMLSYPYRFPNGNHQYPKDTIAVGAGRNDTGMVLLFESLKCRGQAVASYFSQTELSRIFRPGTVVKVRGQLKCYDLLIADTWKTGQAYANFLEAELLEWPGMALDK